MDLEQMKKDLGGGAIFPIGEENRAYAQYFTGECYLNMLTTTGVGIGVVTFAPKTINAYHIHHKGGQILLVTGGRGWYQEEGQPARELRAGDVVNIPPEVRPVSYTHLDVYKRQHRFRPDADCPGNIRSRFSSGRKS